MSILKTDMYGIKPTNYKLFLNLPNLRHKGKFLIDFLPTIRFLNNEYIWAYLFYIYGAYYRLKTGIVKDF
jgi:hypothetical protein